MILMKTMIAAIDIKKEGDAAPLLENKKAYLMITCVFNTVPSAAVAVTI
jgi:hypothetical protein